jgi:N-acetylglucosaminyl-diphospho-decaprenol L-rhamnosyltransferase
MNQRKWTVSIVSHGHGKMVCDLLEAVANYDSTLIAKVIITINSPVIDRDLIAFQATTKSRTLPFELIWLNNLKPAGFGPNHNNAFKLCETEYFGVLNPDIQLESSNFANLLMALEPSVIGLAYPAQRSAGNHELDYARALVTPLALLRKYASQMMGKRELAGSKEKRVDWVSGSFMGFKTSVFRSIGGFDERYFMYCEDVDICLRLQLAGYKLARADASVVHHTQRQTLKNPQHLTWHIKSLLRLWNSDSYKAYKRRFIDASV